MDTNSKNNNTEMNSHVQTKSSERVVVFGSIVQDLVSYVDRFPNPGESFRGNRFRTYCGGKGANQAVMAANLGSTVQIIGRVGNDFFGEQNLKSLGLFGVDTSYVTKSDTASTATASIQVSSDGENSIVVCLGANEELSVKQAKSVENVIAKSRIILCQLEADELGNIEAFKIARKYGVITFFNPAPGKVDLNREILGLSDIICTNENEAEFVTCLKLSTQEEFRQAAKQMLDLGPKVAIVTMGSKGVIVAQKKNYNTHISYIENKRVKAIDTTGAGDCFCGAMAHLIAQDPDGDIVEMVRKASRIATISVQRPGTQISYPFREELLRLGIL